MIGDQAQLIRHEFGGDDIGRTGQQSHQQSGAGSSWGGDQDRQERRGSGAGFGGGRGLLPAFGRSLARAGGSRRRRGGRDRGRGRDALLTIWQLPAVILKHDADHVFSIRAERFGESKSKAMLTVAETAETGQIVA